MTPAIVSLFSGRDICLGSRHTQKLRLKDEVGRFSELILGGYLALFERAVMDNPITNEVFPLGVESEVSCSTAEWTGYRPDCDAVGARSQVKHSVAHGGIGQARHRIAAATRRGNNPPAEPGALRYGAARSG
jgi:hypothetical protein